MAETEFKLPCSSFPELKKIMIAFAKSKSPASLSDLNKLTGISTTNISTNNGFLDSIGMINGGKKKEATEPGKKIGLAFANNMDDEASRVLNSLLTENEFLESMITALGIKPRSNDDFQSHIAYSLGKELKGGLKTGTGTVLEMLLFSKIIEEKDSLLYPKIAERDDTTKLKTKNEEINKVSSESPNTNSGLLTQRITNELGQNVTLNINIQLTIPETENEKVYENFFQAMKKHLLS